MLQIRLFGKPQVICDGTDITPELGNKGCALLCILFLRGGDYYAREKLAAYLWPDSAVSAAKYNLRYTLWKIKKSTDIGEGGRSLIKLDREYCCIDRAYDYICDLQTIDEIDPETRSADELKRACDAFGGELLEGYYFNHCEDLNELILSQRIYYEKRKNRLLMKAAELYERGGDRSRAIRFFNEFRNRLASNLEIYPGSAITQKYAELKAAPAAPEPAPAADSVPGLHVQTYCLRAVPCFWMADTVGKLLDAIGYDVPSGDRTLLRVLGAIQPAAAACVGAEGEVTAAPAAVAQAFIRWLTGLAARQPLAVHIRRAGEMDDVSRGVLEYLLAERPAGLTLLTEDGGALGDMSSGK